MEKHSISFKQNELNIFMRDFDFDVEISNEDTFNKVLAILLGHHIPYKIIDASDFYKSTFGIGCWIEINSEYTHTFLHKVTLELSNVTITIS